MRTKAARLRTEALAILLVLIAASNIVLFLLSQQNTATEDQLDTGLHAACYRLSLLRWAVNKEHIEESLYLNKKVLFLRPTDCEAAVDHPDIYTPPLPIFINIKEAQRLNVPPVKPKEVRNADSTANIP